MNCGCHRTVFLRCQESKILVAEIFYENVIFNQNVNSDLKEYFLTINPIKK